MKILKISAWQPDCVGSPPDWRTKLGQIVVEIELEDGISGLGVGGGGQAGIHVIESVLQECLLKENYSCPQEAHSAMLEHTAFYGRKGIVPMAISGVDLAIWDAYAKQRSFSVYELLTDEPAPATLPMYQTVFDDAEALAAVEQGKEAVKLHVERFGDRPDPFLIRKLVRATREKLGPAKSIMLDAFGRWDVETTLRVADVIYELGVDWIEEPVPPDALSDYTTLNQRSPIPIAGGEHEYLSEGFKDLADRDAVSVFQPDINWCGGLTTLVEIYRIAEEAGIRVVPHRGSEPFSLPVIAALDKNPLAESARKWFTCIDGVAIPNVDGVPLKLNPGFGVRIIEEKNQGSR